MFDILWSFTFWRFLIIKLARHFPNSKLVDYLVHRSGLLYALEQLFRAQGDYASVQRTRTEIRKLEQRFR